MKKVFSIVAVVSMLFATSCCNCNCKCNQEGAQCEQKCDKPCDRGDRPRHHGHEDGESGPRRGEGHRGGPRHHQMNPEMAEKMAKWMNFDSLSVEEQKALIAERKAEIDAREAERKAKKAEMEEKWANFDKLSVEEQKQLLDQRNHIPFFKKNMKFRHNQNAN